MRSRLRARMRCASAATSALLVTPAPLSVVDGWRDGWCATSVDDGWAAVEVSGADAPGALMQATSADLASASPSAAVMIFGLRGLVAQTSSGFRVHIEAPWLETLLDLARRRLRRRQLSTRAPRRG